MTELSSDEMLRRIARALKVNSRRLADGQSKPPARAKKKAVAKAAKRPSAGRASRRGRA